MEQNEEHWWAWTYATPHTGPEDPQGLARIGPGGPLLERQGTLGVLQTGPDEERTPIGWLSRRPLAAPARTPWEVLAKAQGLARLIPHPWGEASPEECLHAWKLQRGEHPVRGVRLTHLRKAWIARDTLQGLVAPPGHGRCVVRLSRTDEPPIEALTVIGERLRHCPRTWVLDLEDAEPDWTLYTGTLEEAQRVNRTLAKEKEVLEGRIEELQKDVDERNDMVSTVDRNARFRRS